jgi:uncharacterized protein
MSAAVLSPVELPYRLREAHSFEASGEKFLYLVPSGAIFSLDKIGKDVLHGLADRDLHKEELVQLLLARGYSPREIEVALGELEQADVILRGAAAPKMPTVPEKTFPLQRIVLNVTNQCNLACGYCY